MALVTITITTIPGYMSLIYTEYETVGMIAYIGSILFSVTLFIVLIFYANTIVDLLKLEKGFQEDRIDLGNLKASDIIKIGTFIIGGPMMINGISELLYILITSFRSEVSMYMEPQSTDPIWIYYVIQVVLGYLFITQYHTIAKILNQNEKQHKA